ncbi:MAG: NAD(P)H-hydrate dehydratase [Acetomicrobium sp.]
MIPLYTAEIAKKIDRWIMDEFSLPGLVLMENAGRTVASYVSQFLAQEKGGKGRVLIFSGPGNNGGDGFVAGRHLLNKGLDVKLISSVSMLERYKGDAFTNANAFMKVGGKIAFSDELSDSQLVNEIKEADICVDALLGVGFKGVPEGEIARLIKALRKASFVVSVDVPSGVESSTGCVPGAAVMADVTITMHVYKLGLYIAPGAFYSGRVLLADIGVHPMLGALTFETNCFLWDKESSLDVLPDRPLGLHKGNRGCVAILGGSDLYRGAPMLSALGALRAGAGIVYIILPEDVYSQSGQFIPEAICLPVRTDRRTLSAGALEVLLPLKEKIDVLIVGPGVGRESKTIELALKLWEKWPKMMVYDADALYALSVASSTLRRRSDVVLTPHEGETARLLGCEPAWVRANRLEAIQKLSLRFGPSVLKGFRSIISDGSQFRICDAGSPALSVPGSGDVLSGIIGTFLASGLDLIDGASLAVWLHAKAGEELELKKGLDGVLSREIADEIRNVIGDIRYAKKKGRLGRGIEKDGKDALTRL